MSEKRLSERMSDASHAVDEAQDALEGAITSAQSTYFEAGIEFERQRIINAIESYRSEMPLDGMFDNIIGIDEVIALIKGEQA